MKQQLQNPAPWINSRYEKAQETEHTEETLTSEEARLSNEIIRLESQADELRMIMALLGGLLAVVGFTIWVLWDAGLIVQ